ncbi:hypothetical protein F4802DRAFT_148361 [Xylaria palmicola]|nr:hypothetical protein F4802DRAFT_148361 [Xylaria palmicola]
MLVAQGLSLDLRLPVMSMLLVGGQSRTVVAPPLLIGSHCKLSVSCIVCTVSTLCADVLVRAAYGARQQVAWGNSIGTNHGKSTPGNAKQREAARIFLLPCALIAHRPQTADSPQPTAHSPQPTAHRPYTAHRSNPEKIQLPVCQQPAVWFISYSVCIAETRSRLAARPLTLPPSVHKLPR